MKIPKATLRNQDNSPVYVSDNSVYTILAAGEDTDGVFSVVEQLSDDKAQTPWHLHENQAETFYVMDGSVTFWVADEVYQAERGAFISIPKNTRHRFQVTSSKARILNSFYPSGFEQFYTNNLPEAKTVIAGENKRQLDWQIIGNGGNDLDTVLLDKESNLDRASGGGDVPFIRYRTDGPGLWGLGILWIVMADTEQTSSVHSFIDELIPQGPSAAPHIHEVADEIFYILDGEMTFFTGDEWNSLKATSNSLVVVPKGTKHSFQIDTPTVHLVNVYAPAGFEHIIQATTIPAQAMTLPPQDIQPPKLDVPKIFKEVGEKYPGAKTKPLSPEEINNEKIVKLFQ